jgi:hypothetical protein
MLKLIPAAAFVSLFALGSLSAPALAQSRSDCEAKAVSGGKALTGAAKTSNVNKCLKDACTAKVDSTKDPNGHKYGGAVRTNMINKCVKEG